MAKFEFNKSAKKKSPRPITEIKISKPKETYDPAKMTKQVEAEFQKAAKEKTPSRTAQEWAKVLPDGTIAEENGIENQCSGKCSRGPNPRCHG